MVRHFLGNPHRADLGGAADDGDLSDDEIYGAIQAMADAQDASDDDSDDDFAADWDDEDYVESMHSSGTEYDSEYDSDEDPGPPIHAEEGDADCDEEGSGEGPSKPAADNNKEAAGGEPSDVAGSVA